VEEKIAHESLAEAKHYPDTMASEKEKAIKAISNEIREENVVIKLLKGDLKKAYGNKTVMQDIKTRLT
jgi:hypothetical protein